MEEALYSPTFGNIDQYAANMHPREPAQGLVPSRMGHYYSQVKVLEKSNSSSAEIIRKLYIVSRLCLLPELGADFPELQITDDGDGASFNRFNWTMEIPREWALGWTRGDSLQELSASILHETRHVEQAWVSVQHFKRKEPRSGVAVWASKAFVSEKAAKILEKVALPNSLDLRYRLDRPGWQVGPEYEHKYSKLRDQLDEVRGALSMAKSFGIGQENVPKLREEHDELFKKYMNHPRERDAFDVENEYHGFYTAKDLGIF